MNIRIYCNILLIFIESFTRSCSSQGPSNGVSFKLAYTRQQDQRFYLSVLELPFDTRQCPVDVFLSLNSSQDMNGLSFYSECLEITYDVLIFTGLAHRMYIPMSDETMCIKPANFTSLFPSVDFGLVIHSSLKVSRLRLNSFIQLLPGYDGTAVSLGFYKDTSERVGLIHSLKMTMFDRAFVTQARLRNMELSFGLMMNLFNKKLYAAHIQGLASTGRQWRDMAVSVRGWFPKGKRSFVDTLERSVIEGIVVLGHMANMRKKEADQQLFEATARLERAGHQLNAANRMFANASSNVNAVEADLVESREHLRQTEINVTLARSEIREAEEAVVCKLQVCLFMCCNATKKQTVLRALEMRRSELVAPLRERNWVRAEVELLEVRLSQAQRSRQLANEALASAQSLYNLTNQYRRAVNNSYTMILEEIRGNLQLHRLAQQHGDNVFNITNITFSVSISEQNNPSAFPITITYDTPQWKNNQLNYVYQFNVPFPSQKETLINDIIDSIISSSQRRRKRRQTSDFSSKKEWSGKRSL